jgi:hypothetical protein
MTVSIQTQIVEEECQVLLLRGKGDARLEHKKGWWNERETGWTAA